MKQIETGREDVDIDSELCKGSKIKLWYVYHQQISHPCYMQKFTHFEVFFFRHCDKQKQQAREVLKQSLKSSLSLYNWG